jgi:hypothetical protein
MQRSQDRFLTLSLSLTPLSLVRTIEELLEIKAEAPVYKPEINGRREHLL